MGMGQYYAHRKGEQGENRIAYLLSGLNRNHYIVLSNVLLIKPFKGKSNVPTVQIDHIVVSVYGIFVIETKNWAGSIYGTEQSKNWKVYLRKQKYENENPIIQNKTHIKFLTDILARNADYLGIRISDIQMYSIVAFSERARLGKLKISDLSDVVYFNQVPNVILNKSINKVFTLSQVEKIANFISDNNVYSSENMDKHVNAIHNKNVEYFGFYNNDRFNTEYVKASNENNDIFNTSNPENIKQTKKASLNRNYTQFISDNDEEKYKKPVSNVFSYGGCLSALLIAVAIPVVCIIVLILFIFLSSALIAIFSNMTGKGYGSSNNSNTSLMGEEIEERNNGDEWNPPTMDITSTADYIGHGTYYDDPNYSYTDAEGVIYDKYLKMYCHGAFTDPTCIDIYVKSGYKKLSFTYTANPGLFSEDKIVTVTVYDLDTQTVIKECGNVKLGSSTTETIDISNYNNIRIVFHDESNGASYLFVKDIILSKN